MGLEISHFLGFNTNLKCDLLYPLSMQNDAQVEILLNKHESLVSLYIHQNKIGWNLISVYVALNVGLATVAATVIKRMPALVFLCILGCLCSFFGARLFQRHQRQISEWVLEGVKVEKALKEKALTLDLFEKCKSFLEEKTKIQNVMWTLTLVWIVATIGTIVIAKFNLDLSYIFS